MSREKKNALKKIYKKEKVLTTGINAGQENILIVDDEEDIRFFLKNILERRGFSVSVAQDGEEGINLIRNSDINIVLCDIMMPKIDGMQFLKKVNDFNSSVEVIMITGYSNLGNCIESIEKGACAYLVKPIEVKDILEAISRAQRNIREKQEMIRKALKMHYDSQKKSRLKSKVLPAFFAKGL